MDVTQTTAAAGATTSNASNKSASNSEQKSASTSLTGDFNTFLRLLTAQMQNQDPLEPTSNTEYVAQLASFSAVEQQILTNDNLSTIMEQLNFGNAGEVASWIGKDVLTQGGYAAYTGYPVTIEVDAVPEADKATLVVRDASDTIVAQITVNPNDTGLTWDGTDQHGEELGAGYYTFSVESSTDGTVISTQSAKVFSTVAEVRVNGDGTELVTVGGVSVDADAVTAIR